MINNRLHRRVVFLASWLLLSLCSPVLHGHDCQYLSEPLDGVSVDAYRRVLKQKLLVSTGDYGVFIMMPSQLGEWAVAVTAVSANKHQPQTFELSLTSATQNIFESNFSSQATHENVPINEVRVAIDKKLAGSIQ